MTLPHIVSWNVLLMKKIEKTKAKNQQKRGRRGHFPSILQEPAKTSRKPENEVAFQVFYKNFEVKFSL